MKNLIIIAILLLFGSCNNIYYEYEILNKSTEMVSVEIITYGVEYQKTLSYTIDPTDRCHIFEHSRTDKGETISKYIKQINIWYGADRKNVKKEFTYNNLQLSEKKGILGNYKVFEFVINNSDLE